jgi:pimeloyl-ACP methyl ester carboxylesterase
MIDIKIAVSGATLVGERRGTESSPLVLVHGMAGARQDWDRLLSALPDDLSTLRYDLRGFGQSAEQTDMPYSHTDDLLALLNAEEIGQAMLVGLSMGGGVALNFALTYPERVSHLILISPALVGWEWSDEWKELWRGVTTAAREGNMALARERWWQHPMFAKVRTSEAARELRHSIEHYHGNQWIRDPQRDERPDIDRLHTLSVPTLLLTAEHDVSDIRLIADMISAAANNVTRIDFAGAGHMLHIERPQELVKAILAFLA